MAATGDVRDTCSAMMTLHGGEVLSSGGPGLLGHWGELRMGPGWPTPSRRPTGEGGSKRQSSDGTPRRRCKRAEDVAVVRTGLRNGRGWRGCGQAATAKVG